MKSIPMFERSLAAWLLLGLAGSWLGEASRLAAQEAPPPVPIPAAAPASDTPASPSGVEVMARGPVHEAFATPTQEAQPTQNIPRQPPNAIEELPPEQKPEGDVVWIGGYWSWDDERKDFLWVSGIWRTQPPNKRWVPGYWRQNSDSWQWVGGFWTEVQQEAEKQAVTYLPAPPAPPETAPAGPAPTAESFYVPGTWVWRGDNYVWRAGYWGRVQPGYVWVPAHYRWTPAGYVFIPGYWDLALARRGVLYAPVVIDPAVIRVGFVYTPAYAVSDAVVVDALFVRPRCCHYYFGDYYGPAYRNMGFESCIVYSRRHYDAIFVYERYERRHDPHWERVQVDICLARHSGRAPVPPRTLAQQNRLVNSHNTTIINNKTTIINQTNVYKTTVLAPTTQVVAAKGLRTTTIDPATRIQARQQAQNLQAASGQRHQVERALPPGPAPGQRPRVASLVVPKTPSSPTRLAPTTGSTNHPSSTTKPSGTHVTAPGSTTPGQPSRPANPPGTPGTGRTPATKLLPPPKPGQLTATPSGPIIPGQPSKPANPPGPPTTGRTPGTTPLPPSGPGQPKTIPVLPGSSPGYTKPGTPGKPPPPRTTSSPPRRDPPKPKPSRGDQGGSSGPDKR